jgi:hypothetical protein
VNLDSPSRGLLVFPDEAIVPEALEGRLVTPFFAITLMNANVTGQHLPIPQDPPKELTSQMVGDNGTEILESLGAPPEQGWVQVLDVRAKSNDGTEVRMTLNLKDTRK